MDVTGWRFVTYLFFGSFMFFSLFIFQNILVANVLDLFVKVLQKQKLKFDMAHQGASTQTSENTGMVLSAGEERTGR